MRILNCDTIYSAPVRDLYKADPGLSSRSYSEQLRAVLDLRFGCWDSYSTAFRSLGHESEEVLLNVPELLASKSVECGFSFENMLFACIKSFQPDVVMCHSIGALGPEVWCEVKRRVKLLAGNFTHAAPNDSSLRQFGLLMSGFHHYVNSYKSKGYPIKYLPLAFDPRHLDGKEPAREFGITFIGGMGYDHVWSHGTQAVAAVASSVPEFKCWGYCGPSTPQIVHKVYQGEIYGRGYIDTLRRSRMTINRHGEVYKGDTSCMRTFEATGCGAMMFTEDSWNLKDLFVPNEECVPYSGPVDLVEKVRSFLGRKDDADRIGRAGQVRTLQDHTYARRAETLASWFEEAMR